MPINNNQDASDGTNHRLSSPLLSRNTVKMNRTEVGKVFRIIFVLALIEVKKLLWFKTIPWGENTMGRINQKTKPVYKNKAH